MGSADGQKKDEVRRRALAVRDALPSEYRKMHSGAIMEDVLQSGQYRRARIILSYSSFRSEVDTDRLNRETLIRGKELYLPKTYAGEKRMSFYPVTDLSKLSSGYQGILEPQETVSFERRTEEEHFLTKEEVLMVMPGVAFDERGFRMGYGGGYYDRYLFQYGVGITSILVAFEEQRIPLLPADEFDVKPDFIYSR